ncbi:MAG: YceI family protein [Arenimonas sp.]|uniref:YceI family protein n=1 Tax=Arenimonas sp. TaxID=1872635 RepID=UPI001B78D161|nr:YceI family protein [Arenimonas sp.]
MRRAAASLWFLLALPVAATDAPLFWRIDPLTSQAQFRVHLRMAIPAEGRFKRIQGEIRPLPEQKLSVRVQLDARELVMDGPAWIQKVTHSADFLDSAAYPEIRFQSLPFSRQVLVSGGDIAGTLTLREHSKPVTFRVLPTQCRQPGVACPMSASGTLNRQDFGIHAYRWSLRDEVVVEFQLKFADD